MLRIGKYTVRNAHDLYTVIDAHTYVVRTKLLKFMWKLSKTEYVQLKFLEWKERSGRGA